LKEPLIKNSRLALGLSLLLAPLPLAAQNAFRFTIKGGADVAFSCLSGEPSGLHKDPITGAAGGLGIEIPLGGKASLGLEALYTQRGFELTTYASQIARYRLDYVEVPLTLRLTFGSPTRVTLFAGPSLGYRLKADISGAGATAADIAAFEQSNRVDGSVDVGMAFAFPIGKKTAFTLDARFVLGFSNQKLRDGRILAGLAFDL